MAIYQTHTASVKNSWTSGYLGYVHFWFLKVVIAVTIHTVLAEGSLILMPESRLTCRMDRWWVSSLSFCPSQTRIQLSTTIPKSDQIVLISKIGTGRSDFEKRDKSAVAVTVAVRKWLSCSIITRWFMSCDYITVIERHSFIKSK